MQVDFNSDYQKKILHIRFGEGTDLSTPEQVQELKTLWLKALKTWHSPYRALIDCQHLRFQVPQPLAQKKALATLFAMLEKLFLKKALGFNLQDQYVGFELPFEIAASEDEARSRFGLDRAKVVKNENFRDLIQIDNHFRQYFMEVSFTLPAIFDDSAKIKILKDKIMNNLMQWHSPWTLLLDAANLEVKAELVEEFAKALGYFKSLFLQEIITYGQNQGEPLPFNHKRLRHVALNFIKAPGNAAPAGEANCSTRKSPVSKS